jgi:hypothetical protein
VIPNDFRADAIELRQCPAKFLLVLLQPDQYPAHEIQIALHQAASLGRVASSKGSRRAAQGYSPSRPGAARISSPEHREDAGARDCRRERREQQKPEAIALHANQDGEIACPTPRTRGREECLFPL